MNQKTHGEGQGYRQTAPSVLREMANQRRDEADALEDLANFLECNEASEDVDALIWRMTLKYRS